MASEEDSERFCSRCYAGVESPEHGEKCVRPGYAEWGESAGAAVADVCGLEACDIAGACQAREICGEASWRSLTTGIVPAAEAYRWVSRYGEGIETEIARAWMEYAGDDSQFDHPHSKSHAYRAFRAGFEAHRRAFP